ncbi:hypothetical protein MPRM_26320 [Mycobacterium parmense]|uniref:LysR family transcriptional regulator n=1 Tax=Mycobacterium parmense TaxID=185642 RepID=A0A7I7YX95_9MYCO|nr:hypothetical protein MPRM_26320 [Mycobacterium parmense]
MTTIAVLGATGTAGVRVVARLRARGYPVVEVSRGHGVDLVSGQGLSQALDGVDLAIDVSNPRPEDRFSDFTQTLVAASRNIVGACAAHEVQRLVVSTIDSIDDPVFDGDPYYEGKRAAKAIFLDAPVATTIVKSTQWYESATDPATVSGDEEEVTVQDLLIQPIAADTVADVLVETALGQTHKPCAITGPEAIRLPELTSKVLALHGDSRRVRPVPPPIAGLATGALLASAQAIVVGPDVDTWLATCAATTTDTACHQSR